MLASIVHGDQGVMKSGPYTVSSRPNDTCGGRGEGCTGLISSRPVSHGDIWGLVDTSFTSIVGGVEEGVRA